MYMKINLSQTNVFGNLSHFIQAVPELDGSLNVSLLSNPSKIVSFFLLKKIDCIVTGINKNVVSYWLIDMT